MIEKIIVIDQIVVTETNSIHVRKATRIMENDQKLSETYHRLALNPGDDISKEDEKVKVICNAVWK